jgi:putative transposase
MLKAIKIRLYPNNEQEIYIGKLLGCYRFVYNKCLEQKQTAYTNDKKNLGLKELGKYFHNELTKSDEYSFLQEHNTKVLKQSIMNMMDAYKNFFKVNKQNQEINYFKIILN